MPKILPSHAFDRFFLRYVGMHRRTCMNVSLQLMFAKRVMQADTSCDFDFLETTFGAAIPELDIH